MDSVRFEMRKEGLTPAEIEADLAAGTWGEFCGDVAFETARCVYVTD